MKNYLLYSTRRKAYWLKTKQGATITVSKKSAGIFTLQECENFIKKFPHNEIQQTHDL